jgi:hypothetical protein
MYAVHMAAVIQIFGLHAYAFRRYGVEPQDDVSTAVEKLKAKAPHLARLLEEAAKLYESSVGF